MKTKNVFLAAIAFVFAIGGAFASMFALQDVYVVARLNSATGPIQCVKTTARCDENTQTPVLCRVQISTAVGTQFANSTASGTIYKTWKAGCANPLFDIGGVEQIATPLELGNNTIYSMEEEL